MIKVNLVGATKRKPVKVGGGPKLQLPTNVLPVVLFLIVVGTAIGGYMWYSSLTTQNAELDSSISNLQAQKAALDAVIKENAIYEARKKALERSQDVFGSFAQRYMAGPATLRHGNGEHAIVQVHMPPLKRKLFTLTEARFNREADPCPLV